MRAGLRVVVAQVAGTWLAALSIALFMRRFRPKSTEITCAYCGHPVPMETADGGIGAVNVAMREHISTECEHHPMRALERRLATAQLAIDALRQIEGRT